MQRERKRRGDGEMEGGGDGGREGDALPDLLTQSHIKKIEIHYPLRARLDRPAWASRN